MLYYPVTPSSCLNSLDIGQFEKQIYKPTTEKKKILCKEKLPYSIGKFWLSRLGPFDVLAPNKKLLNYLALQYFDFECAWRKLSNVTCTSYKIRYLRFKTKVNLSWGYLYLKVIINVNN